MDDVASNRALYDAAENLIAALIFMVDLTLSHPVTNLLLNFNFLDCNLYTVPSQAYVIKCALFAMKIESIHAVFQHVPL